MQGSALDSQSSRWDHLWFGASIATMAGGIYATLPDAAIAIAGERIAWIGPSAEGLAHARGKGVSCVSAEGCWITPGLIDCHTHAVFGGNRSEEFERLAGGESYEAIARAGGGIRSTVRATREASEERLFADGARRLKTLMAQGVTTIEIKSGYGLDLDSERKMLRVARRLGEALPLSVATTYLGLHALPTGADRQRFVAQATGEWLDAIVGEGLADAADAFCEMIAFTPDEVEHFLAGAARRGLKLHVHADQLTDLGGGALAARLGALSADHLEFASIESLEAMAASGCTAVLLPGAFYTLQEVQKPPVAAMRASGVRMAVATDCNPGSSPLVSPLLAMNMACRLFGLTPEEALAGMTIHAAHALGLAQDRGTIEPGKRADFVIWEVERPAELCYLLGGNPCRTVICEGRSYQKSAVEDL